MSQIVTFSVSSTTTKTLTPPGSAYFVRSAPTIGALVISSDPTTSHLAFSRIITRRRALRKLLKRGENLTWQVSHCFKFLFNPVKFHYRRDADGCCSSREWRQEWDLVSRGLLHLGAVHGPGGRPPGGAGGGGGPVPGPGLCNLRMRGSQRGLHRARVQGRRPPALRHRGRLGPRHGQLQGPVLQV